MNSILKTKFLIAALSFSTFSIADAADLVCEGKTISGKTISFVETNNTYLSHVDDLQHTVSISIDEKDFMYTNVFDYWSGHLNGYIESTDNLKIVYQGHFGNIKKVNFNLDEVPDIHEEAFFPSCWAR